MMRARRWLLAAVAMASLNLGACGEEKKPAAARGPIELGEPCRQTPECRRGLICLAGTCAPRDARSTPRELEKAYDLNEQRSDQAIDRYSPYQRGEER